MSLLFQGVSLTSAGAPTSGVFQVETATAAGTVATAGNASVVVTAAGMTGSPITVDVPVALNDTANAIALAIRTTLAANAVIAAFFTVSGATDKVILTRTKSAANDATINIAIADGTSVGVTTAASSANTTAGVRGSYRGVPNGTYVTDTTNTTFYHNTGNGNRPVWTEGFAGQP